MRMTRRQAVQFAAGAVAGVFLKGRDAMADVTPERSPEGAAPAPAYRGADEDWDEVNRRAEESRQ